VPYPGNIVPVTFLNGDFSQLLNPYQVLFSNSKLPSSTQYAFSLNVVFAAQ
jgi:hypothetical protein